MWSCYVIWRCFGGIPPLTQIMRTPVSIVPQVYTAVQSLTPHKVVASGISNHRILLKHGKFIFPELDIFIFTANCDIYLYEYVHECSVEFWMLGNVLYPVSTVCVCRMNWYMGNYWGYIYLLDICVKCLMENLKFC